MNPDLQQAVQLHQAGKAADALPLYAKVLEGEPDNPAALFYGGVAAWTTGDAATALERLDRLIRSDQGEVAEAYYHRGLALAALDRPDDALADYGQAVRLKPALAPAQNNLGSLLRERGDHEAAEAAFAKALAHDPELHEARYNRGLNALQRGDLKAARAWLSESTQRDPRNALARVALIDTLIDLTLQADARSLARASAKRMSKHPLIWNALGQAEQAAGDAVAARKAYEKAHALAPDNALIAMNLAHLQSESADTDAARATYQTALDHDDHAGLRLRLACLMPAIPSSEQAIDTAREGFVEALNELRESDLELADPLNDFGDTPFFLSYHGRNDDQRLLGDLATTLRDLAPSLDYTAPHLDGDRQPGKFRVGFCSHFLFDQSVGRALHAVIQSLPRDQCEVFVFRTPPQFRDDLADRIDQNATVIELPFHLRAAREQIAVARLDLLVYPEIGMDALTYYLAHARLAPLQWTTLGHPCTSGLPGIDDYVSFQSLETENGDDHYSERLIRLPEGAIYPDYPMVPQEAWGNRTRADLGLGDDPVMICPQSLFKLMPHYDSALAQILDGHPEATLLLPEARYPGLTEAMRKRLTASLGDSMSRVRFFPRRSRADFVALVAACDVMLDPYPVGGGITTWDALATGTPIVTLPGGLMRSRFAASALETVGLDSLIAGSEKDYVATVQRLLSDPEERQTARRQLAEGSTEIYQDRRAAEGWVEEITRRIGA